MKEIQDEPLVSVGIVTYNQEAYIGSTLDSVITQVTDFGFEVVIGDDASSDKTQEIIKRYAKQYPGLVRLILREKNIGGQNNIIDVYKNCRGRYIAHLDGDDLMLPGKLQKQVEFFRNHQNCSVVHHKCRMFDSLTNKTIRYSNKNLKRSIAKLEDLLVDGNFIIHSSKMFDTTKMNMSELKPFKYAMSVDYLYNVICTNKHEIGYIDEVLGEYRKHGGGVTTNTNNYWRLFAGNMKIIPKAKEYGVNKEVLKLTKAKIYFTFARAYINKKNFHKYRKLMEKGKRALGYVPKGEKVHYYFRKIPYFVYFARFVTGQLDTVG